MGAPGLWPMGAPMLLQCMFACQWRQPLEHRAQIAHFSHSGGVWEQCVQHGVVSGSTIMNIMRILVSLSRIPVRNAILAGMPSSRLCVECPKAPAIASICCCLPCPVQVRCLASCLTELLLRSPRRVGRGLNHPWKRGVGQKRSQHPHSVASRIAWQIAVRVGTNTSRIPWPQGHLVATPRRTRTSRQEREQKHQKQQGVLAC